MIEMTWTKLEGQKATEKQLQWALRGAMQAKRATIPLKNNETKSKSQIEQQEEKCLDKYKW